MIEFTPHALARALDVAVDPSELRDLITHPEQRFWSNKFECWTYQRGRLAAGVSEDSGRRVVLTVLWRTDGAWASDASRAPLPAGRYVPDN